MIFAKRIRKIGGCTVASRIGRGRYGVCFLARDAGGRKVVLKRLRRRMWKKNRADYHHEAVILSGLCHPGVPELLGVVNEPRGYYFVLEYMEGYTLADWLFEKKKIFSAEEVCRIGTQLFGILEYLHSRSVVHGDISIANVVDDGKKVSVIDFGLARYSGEKELDFSLDHARAANVLIYLLYSGYSGRGSRPWHEELPLDENQRKFLLDLMQPGGKETEGKGVYRSTSDIKKRFLKYFGQSVRVAIVRSGADRESLRQESGQGESQP